MKLKQAIDELGKVLEEKKKLEKVEKEIKDRIKKAVEGGKLTEGKYKGNKYTMTISVQASPIINPEKVYNKIKDITLFCNCVKVNAKDVRRYLSDKEIEECIESYTKTVKIAVKEG